MRPARLRLLVRAVWCRRPRCLPPPGYDSIFLKSISCVTPTSCVAGGVTGPSATLSTFADGEWTTTTPSSDGSYINDVACNARRCIATGFSDQSLRSIFYERIGDGPWTTPDIHGYVGSAYIFAPTCSPGGRCFVQVEAERFDTGQTTDLLAFSTSAGWTDIPYPDPTPTNESYPVLIPSDDMSCTDNAHCVMLANDLAAAKGPLVEVRFTHGSLTVTPLPRIPSLSSDDYLSSSSIDCTSPSSCAAAITVGSQPYPTHARSYLLLLRNGTWTVRPAMSARASSGRTPHRDRRVLPR